MKKDLLSATVIAAMFMSILLVSAGSVLVTSGGQLTAGGVGMGLFNIINAPSVDQWFIVFPSTSGKPSSSNCALVNASPSDWTATGFLMGMLTKYQHQNYDTDPAVWANLAPVRAIDYPYDYASFGGPIVNNFACYFEKTTAGSGVVMAIYQSSGGKHQFVENSITHPVLNGIAGDFVGQPLEIATSSAGFSGRDLFLLEAFSDPVTHNAYIITYGFTYYGTFAAGIYLKFLAPPLPGVGSLDKALYIVEWNGIHGAGALPAADDTYTIVYVRDS